MPVDHSGSAMKEYNVVWFFFVFGIEQLGSKSVVIR